MESLVIIFSRHPLEQTSEQWGHIVVLIISAALIATVFGVFSSERTNIHTQNDVANDHEQLWISKFKICFVMQWVQKTIMRSSQFSRQIMFCSSGYIRPPANYHCYSLILNGLIGSVYCPNAYPESMLWSEEARVWSLQCVGHIGQMSVSLIYIYTCIHKLETVENRQIANKNTSIHGQDKIPSCESSVDPGEMVRLRT